MRKTIVGILLFVTALGMGGGAGAVSYVAPGAITATASQDAFGLVPAFLTDQIPMDLSNLANPLSGWDSTNYWHTNSSHGFTSPASGNTAMDWLRYDFSSPKEINQMLVWNGAAGLPDRALKDVVIWYSTDGGASWIELASAQWAHTDSGFTYRPPSDVVDFGGASVDAVVVDILTNWGDPYTMMSEVAFQTTESPPPGTAIGYLPDGSEFMSWEPESFTFSKAYYVSQKHINTSDNNPGTEELPFKTINKAAEVLQPGERVLVSSGVYRECVRPARGGTDPQNIISYEAVPGQQVIITGAEEPELQWQASIPWIKTPDGAPGAPEGPLWLMIFG